MRLDGGVAAKDAVDLRAFQAGIRDRQLRGLLIRSSVEEPSCLPYAVIPTPVMKLMARRLRSSSSFRDAPLGADPESRDSGFAAARRPGMTAENS
jgi:hypothetical protein